MLPVFGKKAVLEWCMKGLIGSSYVCPKCGKSMELREKTVVEIMGKNAESRSPDRVILKIFQSVLSRVILRSSNPSRKRNARVRNSRWRCSKKSI
ncbi:hypothetical protein TNCV_3116271 [Trichonephila clavipes]|nr:hypothetical protein TNCV_3116271 [Trichonephila clavipes]